MMRLKQVFCLFAALMCGSFVVLAHQQQPNPQPLKLAIAGLTHGHVQGILARPTQGNMQIVGIYESNAALAERLIKQHKLRQDLVFSNLDKMLDAVKPEAVAAFGSTYDHLKVVEACAPRGIHVMVEKPLAVSLQHAASIEALAKKHNVHVLTNYETTWYPSTQAVYDLVYDQRAPLGPIRKIVIHDGHPGPKEIGVNAEFLEWLTDPVLNGGGALTDFGCYGANLATWLMKGVEPLRVTAVTQQFKPDIYPKVEDEATIILEYPRAQVIIQASWNWPFNRKDMEVYGRAGEQVHALDGKTMRLRTANETQDRTLVLEQKSSAALSNPFAYLAAVIRGEIKVANADLSSLSNNMTVTKILDAAKQSAATGKTVQLNPR